MSDEAPAGRRLEMRCCCSTSDLFGANRRNIPQSTQTSRLTAATPRGLNLCARTFSQATVNGTSAEASDRPEDSGSSELEEEAAAGSSRRDEGPSDPTGSAGVERGEGGDGPQQVCDPGLNPKYAPASRFHFTCDRNFTFARISPAPPLSGSRDGAAALRERPVGNAALLSHNSEVGSVGGRRSVAPDTWSASGLHVSDPRRLRLLFAIRRPTRPQRSKVKPLRLR